MRKFVSTRPGILRILDLDLIVKKGEVFELDERDVAVSSSLKNCLKAGWIKEIKDNETPRKTISSDKSSEDKLEVVEERIKETQKEIPIQEKKRKVEVGRLKKLKEFKQQNPGIIDSSLPIEEQLKQYEEYTTGGKEIVVESKQEQKREKEKPKKEKVKHNVAPERTLPSNWDSLHWKERIKFLKENGKSISTRELEELIDESSPAVSAVIKRILLDRKKEQLESKEELKQEDVEENGDIDFEEEDEDLEEIEV